MYRWALSSSPSWAVGASLTVGQLASNNTVKIDSKVKTDISAEHEEVYEFEVEQYWKMA